MYQDLIKSGEVLADGRLPPILPIVLYNGKERWTAADDLFDLIPTVPGIVEQFKLRAKHLVIDKNAFKESQSASEKNLVAAVFSLEHASSPEAMQALIQNLQDWLVDRSDLRRTFAHWISQTLIRNREYSIVLPEVHDLLELKVMLADTVEAWAHAYEAKGEAKGKAEGEMLLLQKLLTKRFGAIPAPITAQIAGASLQDIERWFDLAIDANRLSDIFEK